MAASSLSSEFPRTPEANTDGVAPRELRPAASAATRVSAASFALGVLGLGSSVFVISRLIESWRVAPASGSHEVSILGQRLAYPAANTDAIIVVALAALGLVVLVTALSGACRELVLTWRFTRPIAGRPTCRLLGHPTVVIADDRPRAFCCGLVRPVVCVSTGAIALLDPVALDAVLAHEHHHARRRDPLRLACGRVLARALFFLPWLAELVRRQEALAELGADESAVASGPAGRAGLARAMLSFADSTDGSLGVDPARIDFLIGETPTPGFPLAPCAAAAAAIALVIAVAFQAGAVAAGSATLAPPFLSGQPCIVVLALIPGSIGGLVAIRWRRERRRDRDSRPQPASAQAPAGSG